MKFKIGQRLIFKDGSIWIVKDIFDNSKLTNHIINLPRFRYTLIGEYSEIFMYEGQIDGAIMMDHGHN